MADIFYRSWDDPNMATYPVWLQAAAGAPEISYGANEWRQLTSAVYPTSGVARGTHWVVTQGAAADTVDITAGTGIIAGGTGTGKYLVRTSGTVTVPVFPAPSSGTRYHHLVAQVLDVQAGGFGTNPGWQFRVLEDTGSGYVIGPGDAATSIAKIARTAGSSTITITDDRAPAYHQCGGIWSRTTSVTESVGRNGLVFNTEEDDLYNYATTNALNTLFYIRHPGIWDIEISGYFAAPIATFAEMGVCKNGVAEGTEVVVGRAAPEPGGSWVHARTTFKYIPGPNDYLQPYMWVDGGVTVSNIKFTAYRREYRAS